LNRALISFSSSAKAGIVDDVLLPREAALDHVVGPDDVGAGRGLVGLSLATQHVERVADDHGGADVVRHEHDGVELVHVGHFHDEAHDVVERLRIEAAERLVHQEQATRLHDLLRDGDPLPLPARELRGVEAPAVGEPERLEQLGRALVRLLRRHPPDATRELEVAADGAVLEQRVVLEDEAHGPGL
jgi:hypothetical protein